MKIPDKVTIITGSSQGIGKASARLFAENKARVVVVARHKKEVDETVSGLQKSGAVALGFSGDVRSIDGMRRMKNKVLGKFGRIDILINNAGIANWKNFLDLKPEDWNKEVDINFKGILSCTYVVAPVMIRQKDGVIINIASGAGKTAYSGLSVYSATKFAVLGFTEGFAQEVIDDNVRVYAVCPGMTKTQMTNFQGMPPEKVAKRILETAEEGLGLQPGENTEIYS